MKIGLFGGTFDPIHLAHLILADEAIDQLNLSHVYFILTPYPPHKIDRHISSLEHRLEMLNSAIGNNPQFILSRVDIDRQPPHYAVDTVKIFVEEYPSSHICYLMGGDSLHDLPTWYDSQGFVDSCDSIGVMRRPDDQIDLIILEKKIPGVADKVSYVNAPLIEISGSKIREYIALGGPYRYYLPESVYQLIEDKKLYR